VEPALKRLLTEALQALGASLAVIRLPAKGMTVRVDSNERPLPHAGKVVQEFDLWLQHSGDKGEIAGQLTFEPLDCGVTHTVAIASNSGHFEGVLLIALPDESATISRRQKTLIEAIAANIGDIIDARFNSLTGLINQCEFDYVLQQSIANRKDEYLSDSVLHVNIDHLNDISQRFGGKAANAAICETAATLRAVLGPTAIIAHLGTDQFGILLHECPADRGWTIGQDVRRAIREMNVDHDEPIKLTASVGVASVSGNETVASVQAAARIACKIAKDRGRDRVALYNHRDATRLHTDAAFRVARNVQAALREDGFQLYCQLIDPLTPTNRTRHYEILLRGIDEDGNSVGPSEFMPQAEHNHLMPAIDRWVVSHALEAIADVQRCLDARFGQFSINLSGQTLCDSGLLEFIRNELSRMNVSPELVCFEVTETAAILNIDQAIDLMSNLREIGCRFSLDDFGSGLSSFSYLKSLPIDYLKIDGQFVREIVEDPVSNAMVSAINQMSHALGLKTIAEFVENKAIRTQLAGIGVDFGQGNGIEEPVPLKQQLEQMVKVRPIRGARLR
jgi:diguanylate cyclase (GGDEF)-like protein